MENMIKQYSDYEREMLYRAARMCDEENLPKIADEMIDLLLDSPHISAIKATALGMSIFRLLNTDTLDTYVGLQRLLEAGMMIEPEATISILEKNGEDAIADELRGLL